MQTSTPTAIQELKGLLEHVGFAVSYIGNDEHPGHPYEELLILGSAPEQPRTLMLRLSLLNQVRAQVRTQVQNRDQELEQPAQKLKGDENLPEAQMLQFFLALPVLKLPLKPKQIAELPQLVLALNALVPVGQFGYVPRTGFYLRNTLLWQPGSLLSPVMVEMSERLIWCAEQLLEWLDVYWQGEALDVIQTKLSQGKTRP